jgi:GntR family transcriptional regulator/MocR family aminotransferase
VWVEDPGYSALRAVSGGAAGRDPGRRRGPTSRPIAWCRGRRACCTSHQYPLGVTPPARRFALLRWAARARAIIIEDDYDSEFHHRGRPLTALHGLDDAGCVVYVGTFSKSMVPGIRLGYFVVPPALVEAFAASRVSLATPASSFEQATLARFLADGHFASHLRRMRVAYRERSEALVAALGRLRRRARAAPCDTACNSSRPCVRGSRTVASRTTRPASVSRSECCPATGSRDRGEPVSSSASAVSGPPRCASPRKN